ncbi:ribonucleotide-diphosphate reductase subunit beta, partial [Phocaeicola coprocola]|nr:ribonucleotide-diphosphate reductase subunit beta [Phocaeicola coprocola]MBM6904512.1 ribonucleotide-diphosphate reductase subunit beta [Phocaeicola coprocola]
FARFCSLLSRRLKITDGFRATWIREDREQMKGTHGLDKLSNLIFHPIYFQGRDVFLVDDIVSTGENFTQMKRRLMQLGANSVTGLFLGRTVKNGKG